MKVLRYLYHILQTYGIKPISNFLFVSWFFIIMSSLTWGYHFLALAGIFKSTLGYHNIWLLLLDCFNVFIWLKILNSEIMMKRFKKNFIDYKENENDE